MKQAFLVVAILSIVTPNRAQDTVTPGEQEALVWDTGNFRFHYLLFLPADYGADQTPLLAPNLFSRFWAARL